MARRPQKGRGKGKYKGVPITKKIAVLANGDMIPLPEDDDI